MKFELMFAQAVVYRQRRALVSFVASLLLAFAATNASAQTTNARPVARLISSSRQVTSSTMQPRIVLAHASARPSVALAPVAATSIEREAFDLINAQRKANGESPLVWDGELCRMARAHSANMAQQNFFNHVGPDGMDTTDRARLSGVNDWRALGENIAYNQGYDDPAAFAVERWMQSAKHRDNILRGTFNRSAIGAARTADGRVYLTQVFITR